MGNLNRENRGSKEKEGFLGKCLLFILIRVDMWWVVSVEKVGEIINLYLVMLDEVKIYLLVINLID